MSNGTFALLQRLAAESIRREQEIKARVRTIKRSAASKKVASKRTRDRKGRFK